MGFSGDRCGSVTGRRNKSLATGRGPGRGADLLSADVHCGHRVSFVECTFSLNAHVANVQYLSEAVR
jgi:hypothetical protein